MRVVTTPIRNRAFRPPAPPQLSSTNLADNKEYARRWRRMKFHTSFDRVAIVLTAIIFVAVVVFYVVGRFGIFVRALL